MRFGHVSSYRLFSDSSLHHVVNCEILRVQFFSSIPLRRISVGASLRVHVLLDGSDLRVPSVQDQTHFAISVSSVCCPFLEGFVIPFSLD